jgi:hypothetical protein
MVEWCRYRFCKLEDDFGTAEEREVAVLSDDQLSNSTPGKPSKIAIKKIHTIRTNYVRSPIYGWFCFVNEK